MAKHLGEFEQLVLFALVHLGDGAYGLAIRRDIEARTGRSVSQGAVYMTLNRLADRGYVRAHAERPADGSGGRPRKHYRLEPAGARTLQRVYAQMSAMADGALDTLADIADGTSPDVRGVRAADAADVERAG